MRKSKKILAQAVVLALILGAGGVGASYAEDSRGTDETISGPLSEHESDSQDKVVDTDSMKLVDGSGPEKWRIHVRKDFNGNLVWAQHYDQFTSDVTGKDTRSGRVTFHRGTTSTISGTEAIDNDLSKRFNIPVGTYGGAYATDGGRVEFYGGNATISGIHADTNGQIIIRQGSDVSADTVALQNGSYLQTFENGTLTVNHAFTVDNSRGYFTNGNGNFGDIAVQNKGELNFVNGSQVKGQNVTLTGNGTLPTVGTENSYSASMEIWGEKTKADFNTINLTDGADLDIGAGAEVNATTVSSDKSLIALYKADPDQEEGENDTEKWPGVQFDNLNLANNSELTFIGKSENDIPTLTTKNFTIDSSDLSMRDSEDDEPSEEVTANITADTLTLRNASDLGLGEGSTLTVNDTFTVDTDSTAYLEGATGSFKDITVQNRGELDFDDGSQVTAQNVAITGNGTLPTVEDEDSYSASMEVWGQNTKAELTNVTLTNGADLAIGEGAEVNIGTLSLDKSLAAFYNADPDDQDAAGVWPKTTIGTLSAKNGAQISFVGQNGSEAASLKFTGITLDNASMTMENKQDSTSSAAKAAPKMFVLRRAPAPQEATPGTGSGLEGTTDTLSISNNGKLDLVNGAKLNVAKSTTLSSSGTVAVGEDSTLATQDLTVNGGTANVANGASLTTGNTAAISDNGAVNLADGASMEAQEVAISNGGAANLTGGASLATKNLSLANRGAANLTQGTQLSVNDLNISGGNANVQGGSSLTTGTLTQNGGAISLGANENDGTNTVTVTDAVNGNLAVKTTNTGNKVNVTGADQTGLKSATVEGSGKDYNSDALANSDDKVKELAKTVEGLKGNTTVISTTGDINGQSSFAVNQDGQIISRNIAENVTNRQITDLASLSLITWRQENNDLNKRLGEVRDSKGDDGIWARMSRGETSFHGTRYQYNYYQLGYDKKLSDDWILGGAFSYTDGDDSFRDGSGKTKHRGFAVYGSNLRDDGSYIDLIAKYARLKNEYDTPLGVGSGDYSTNGYSFSAEYGKRFKQDAGFWIEPQVELTYGHVDSVNYSTDNNARVHQDSMDSFVGRLGFSLGKDVSRGNVYLRASYLYDFDGDIKATMSNSLASRDYREDIGGGWWEYGVGTNLNLGHDTHFYLDLERAQGGPVKTDWQWNAGVRYAF